MGYGITGWKFGGRQSITQNLYPGQFRGMGKPHFKTSLFVQNNYYGNMGASMMYDDHCCGYSCDGGGGSNKFMNWMLGLGMFGQMLGGILGAFGLGGGSSETTNTTTTTTTTTNNNDEFAGVKSLYPDGNFAKVGNKYYCVLNGTRYEGDSIDDLMSKLPTGTASKPDEPITPPPESDEETPETPASNTPAGNTPDGKVRANGGAGTSGAASRSGNDNKAGAGNEEWYSRDADKSSIEGSISKQKIQAADTTPKGAALYIAKTVAAEKNRNLTPEQLNKLADAIIAKNPSVFDAKTGKLLSNARFDKLDIPNAKTLDANYGAKKATQSAPPPKGKTTVASNKDGTFTIKNNGSTVATMEEAKYGWDGGDAHLYINGGKNKGEWQFNNGAHLSADLNLKRFKFENGKFRLQSGEKCTNIRNKKGVELPVRVNNDRSMSVQVNGNWIPLETFMSE